MVESIAKKTGETIANKIFEKEKGPIIQHERDNNGVIFKKKIKNLLLKKTLYNI